MSTRTLESINPQMGESTIRDYITLMKPGVMSLVVFTGIAGMVVAPGQLHPLQYALTLLCIALASGAGAAMNMWYDRDIDAIMLRTATRPVPAGRVAPDDALAFGMFLAFGAVLLMSLALNIVAALLLAVAIAVYVVIYTLWLKRRTPQNIVIGGAAGAFPPMIGWAAVTGDVSIAAIILFTIIFLWTPPHFWALALYRNSDYRRANIPMMPVMRGKAATIRLMAQYTWALIASTLALPALGHAGLLYTTASILLGAYFIYCTYRLQRHHNNEQDIDRVAKHTFAFSILYLFALFTALMIDNMLII